jgi:hypothetical protein
VAISWHLIEKLKLDKTKIKQIVFHGDYYLVNAPGSSRFRTIIGL